MIEETTWWLDMDPPARCDDCGAAARLVIVLGAKTPWIVECSEAMCEKPLRVVSRDFTPESGLEAVHQWNHANTYRCDA